MIKFNLNQKYGEKEEELKIPKIFHMRDIAIAYAYDFQDNAGNCMKPIPFSRAVAYLDRPEDRVLIFCGKTMLIEYGKGKIQKNKRVDEINFHIEKGGSKLEMVRFTPNINAPDRQDISIRLEDYSPREEDLERAVENPRVSIQELIQDTRRSGRDIFDQPYACMVAIGENVAKIENARCEQYKHELSRLKWMEESLGKRLKTVSIQRKKKEMEVK